MPADAINHFKLEKSVDGNTWTTVSNAISPNSPYETTLADGDSAPMQYRMTEVTNTGIEDLSNTVTLLPSNNPGDTLWVRVLQSPLNDAGSAVAVDSIGNVVEASQSSGNYVRLTKYSPSGNILYDNLITTAVGRIQALVIDAEGYIYATGYYIGQASFGGATFPATGEHSMMIVRFKPDLTHDWSYGFSGLSGDVFGNGLALRNGRLYITGSFYALNLGGGNMTSPYGSSIFVGNLKALDGSYDGSSWQKQFGTGTSATHANPSSGKGVGVDGTGNIYVAGSCPGNTEFTTGIEVGTGVVSGSTYLEIGAFLLKLNSSGVYQAAKFFQVSGSNQLQSGAQSIAVTSIGEVAFTGNLRGTALFGSTTETAPVGLTAIIMARYDSGLNYVWHKKVTALYVDSQGLAASVDTAGNMIFAGLGGQQCNFGGGNIPFPSNVYGGAFVVKYSPAGVYRWAKVYDTNHSAWGVAVDTLASIFVTGSWSNDSGNPGTDFGDTSHGDYSSTGTAEDTFLLKLAP